MSCPKQFMIDVNDRYQRGVALVTSLATASLILPIIFLKDIVNVSQTALDAEGLPTIPPVSIASLLTEDVYLGWKLLSASIALGVIYYYFSAKWVKLAWGEKPDIFWVKTNKFVVELCLDISYLAMFFCFGYGLYKILNFIVSYLPQVNA